MRSTVLWLALAIVATAVGGLLIFGGSGSVLGLSPDHFASLARLSVVLLIAAVVVAGFRGRVRPPPLARRVLARGDRGAHGGVAGLPRRPLKHGSGRVPHRPAEWLQRGVEHLEAAPGLTAPSVRMRRKARAPGRPWNRPSM